MPSYRQVLERLNDNYFSMEEGNVLGFLNIIFRIITTSNARYKNARRIKKIRV